MCFCPIEHIVFVLELFSISVLFQECFFNAIPSLLLCFFFLSLFTFFIFILPFSSISRCMHIAIKIAPAPITEAPVDLAKKCDPEECVLPYCFCSKDGTLIPGGLEAEDVSRHLLKWQPGRDYS